MQRDRGSPDDDENGTAAIVRGEPAAIDRWYRREWPVVWRIAFGFLADAVEAEDVAQDAMVKMLDRAESWGALRSWSGWRATVVANACRDRVRSLSTRRVAETTAEVDRRKSARTDNPQQALENAETRDLIESALSCLSDREREVFVLKDLECVATEDVAASLEIDAGTVRSLLSLARRRLRDRLAGKVQSRQGGP